jgi:hypothetical protein
MLVRVGAGIDSQLRVIWAPSTLGEGTGYLTASGDSVSLKAPGAAVSGTGVNVIDGAREKVFASGSTTKYVVVERDGDADLDCADVPLVFDTQKDPHELLAEVDAAISRTLTAISAGSGDERIQHESLANLQKYKANLVRQISIADGRAPTCMSPDFSSTAGSGGSSE